MRASVRVCDWLAVATPPPSRPPTLAPTRAPTGLGGTPRAISCMRAPFGSVRVRERLGVAVSVRGMVPTSDVRGTVCLAAVLALAVAVVVCVIGRFSRAWRQVRLGGVVRRARPGLRDKGTRP